MIQFGSDTIKFILRCSNILCVRSMIKASCKPHATGGKVLGHATFAHYSQYPAIKLHKRTFNGLVDE